MTAVLLAILLTAAPGEAQLGRCDCFRPHEPPCASYWNAPAIFVGRVDSLKWLSSTTQTASLTVVESFRGVSSTTFELTGHSLNKRCGLPLRASREFFIYAYRAEDGSWTTSYCAGTREVEDAGADLNYARAIKDGSALLGHISGQILLARRNLSGATVGPPTPVADVTVHVETGDRREDVVTNHAGDFSIDVRAAGSYTVRPELPERYSLAKPVPPIELRDPRACSDTAIALLDNGRVAGKVVDSTGHPIAGLTIALATTTGSQQMRTITDRDGRYALTAVPPGRFLLGIPGTQTRAPLGPPLRVFYPGIEKASGAAKLMVGAGERVVLEDFRIPATWRYVTVAGVVVDPDGVPAPGARIYLKRAGEDDYARAEPATADAFGRFVIAALAGPDYQLFAEYTHASSRPRRVDSSEQVRVQTSSALEPLRLMLRRLY